MDQQNISSTANGTNGHVNGHAQEQPKLKRPKSATHFLNGRVVTFVIPIRTFWGELQFRVSQARLGLDNSLSDLIREEDLWDAIRGICEARRWIKKRQRVNRWKELVAGLL
jgi:hypothetical protein